MTHDIPGALRAKLAKDHVYTAEQAARMFGVAPATVTRWLATGLLRGTQVVPSAPWSVQVTEEDYRRLAPADAPAGWLPLRAAARALGVSQQTVLQRLKSGQLQGVRVRNGGRTAWRIHVPSMSYENTSSLFE